MTSTRFTIVRYLTVGVLPLLAAAGYVIFAILARTPASGETLGRAISRTEDLRGAAWALFLIVALASALALMPWTSGYARLLGDAFLPPLRRDPLRELQGRARRRQMDQLELMRERLARLVSYEAERHSESKLHPQPVIVTGQIAALHDRIDQKAAALRARYAEHRLGRTTLGNVLAAIESAGSEYGLHMPTVWPRLYAVLGDRMRATVDARRIVLDAYAAFCIYGLLTGLVVLGIGESAPWIITPLVIVLLAIQGTVRAAMAYGEAVRVAFDLHRFDLYAALHLPMPASLSDERRANARLNRWLQDGYRSDAEYEHPSEQSVTLAGSIREALAPATPSAFRGAVAADVAEVASTEGTDAEPEWHLVCGQEYTLVVAVGLGWAYHLQPERLLANVPGAVRSELLVAAGISTPLVSLDVEIDAPFLRVQPARHTLREDAEEGSVLLKSTLYPDASGTYDLRLAVYSSGRLIQAVLMSLVVDEQRPARSAKARPYWEETP